MLIASISLDCIGYMRTVWLHAFDYHTNHRSSQVEGQMFLCKWSVMYKMYSFVCSLLLLAETKAALDSLLSNCFNPVANIWS